MRKLTGFALLLVVMLGGCFWLSGPMAVIDASPRSIQGVVRLTDYPQMVSFDGSRSSGEIIRYSWTVLDADGKPLGAGEGKSFVFNFEKKGRYRVRLEVEDIQGDIAQAEVEVVANKPPVARISGPREAGVGDVVTFSARNSSDDDGEIVEYRWNFGDGSWSWTDEAKETHKYENRGQYMVTLVVVDDLGGISEPDSYDILIYGGCCGN